jgi:hypothetical protein
MVIRRVIGVLVLLVAVLSQTGCCCCKKHALRENACCAPAAPSCACEPVNCYRPMDTMLMPTAQPPLMAAPVVSQPH